MSFLSLKFIPLAINNLEKKICLIVWLMKVCPFYCKIVITFHENKPFHHDVSIIKYEFFYLEKRDLWKKKFVGTIRRFRSLILKLGKKSIWEVYKRRNLTVYSHFTAFILKWRIYKFIVNYNFTFYVDEKFFECRNNMYWTSWIQNIHTPHARLLSDESIRFVMTDSWFYVHQLHFRCVGNGFVNRGNFWIRRIDSSKRVTDSHL